MNPDYLSSLDEKVEHVLGEFMQDFQGGVSSANLGAKFGGYGSFLPIYTRSLDWSQLRPPSEDSDDASTLTSTRTSRIEASESSSVASCGSSLPITPGDCSTPTSRRRSSPKSKNRRYKNSSPRGSRVACTNLSVSRNGEIYRSLGLDGSPTSSLEDGCVDSGGLSYEINNDFAKSSTSEG
ncbi:hypothetical protein Leryth_002711 [Lithospermum erythrorhizon]|nr:hypothetical protein Leryth_002711 [Lithospermum erythrorhizon]